MTEREIKLKQALASNPAGAAAAANLDAIVAKMKTAENIKTMNKINQNPLAGKAMAGDAEAMSALMRDLIASDEGKSLIEQVKKAAEGQ